MKAYLTASAIVLTLVLLQSCGNNGTKTSNSKADTATKVKAAPAPEKTAPATRPAIINIIDTVATKRIVVCFKDSAASFERISPKLAQIYGAKLGELLKKNNLKQDGPLMAWYKGPKAPYFFEAGVPVAKKPAKLTPGAFIKEVTADSAVVAHFYGPYNLLSQGYDAVNDWLKDRKKRSTAPPYEIYVGDPYDKEGKPVDPYSVRTDIVFPRK